MPRYKVCGATCQLRIFRLLSTDENRADISASVVSLERISSVMALDYLSLKSSFVDKASEKTSRHDR